MEPKIGVVLVLVLSVGWGALAQSAVNCTATGSGRFADPDDITCQNYTLCVLDTTTGIYLSYNYTCPTTSLFNPNTQQCTAAGNYVCNVTNTTTSSVCTEDGYVADPNSTDCTTYIECVQINNTFIETTYTCPSTTYYDPDTTLCDPNYNCTTTANFSCTAAGRFANTADTTCQTYYLCVYLAANSSYVQYEYACPTTSVFSPTSSVCTTSYTCTTA